MSEITVAKYLADALVKNGITQCFMVTGGGAMYIDDALGHKNGLKVVFNHHEQACAIAAEAYTRYTGNIAAVSVTSGPGGTNALTGVLGGWLDSIPMLIISGQIKRVTMTDSCPELALRQLGDQEFNIVDTVKTMTKYAVVVDEPDNIAYELEKALYYASKGRGGPVWIDIPLDIQKSVIDTRKLRHYEADKHFSAKVEISAETVVDVIEKINKAKSPLILVGEGIRFGKAEEKFLKLVEKWKIPVVTEWNAGDILAYDNPYYAGLSGTVGTHSGNIAIRDCDLLISLGSRLCIRTIGYGDHQFASNAYKVAIDADANELHRPTIRIDLPICGEIADFIDKALSDTTMITEHRDWLKYCKALVKAYPVVQPEYRNKYASRINPYVFLDELFMRLQKNDKVICGNGSACVMTFQAAKIKQGQRMFTNSGCAAMGYGLPAALGVAVANNKNRTICIDGDGSIMMNVQELATIAHNKLKTKIFIINNDGYHSIRQTQTNYFNKQFVGVDCFSGLGFPSFRKLSGAFGLRYYKIDDENSCAEVLDKILSDDRPCVCEVFVDTAQKFEPKFS